ncbi:hypothetical protein GWK47_006775 [Chionoecetes opilio]|uniref:Uncharacterized protein n=1 Tax=Chionoecetes opilio TaxID=41210 RepID=A0A8J4YA58_CHIOP|nr:hypothetical protein GWK47_006775 [Chionoecetes opilio]
MQPAPLQPLQHRRDVAGLCVTYKILKQGAPHLATLRQPWATPHSYSTRDARKRDQQLIVPFARTDTFFRSFLPRYSRLWNRVVRQTDMHQAATLHIFKCAMLAESNWVEVTEGTDKMVLGIVYRPPSLCKEKFSSYMAGNKQGL